MELRGAKLDINSLRSEKDSLETELRASEIEKESVLQHQGALPFAF